MKPYYEDASVTIYHGDCRDVLPELSGIATCVTDPPYGLSFMGRDWDHGVPGEHFWSLIRDALLPGAMCLAFGGTRTFHRLTCAIEDAGFEIRDCLMFLYGCGFPKSLDISKAIDNDAGAEREVVAESPWLSRKVNGSAGVNSVGLNDDSGCSPITAPATEAAQQWHGWGTALKPAWEPIILAMKPLDGTFAQNALEHGVAGLNIDGCRIGLDGEPPPTGSGDRRNGTKYAQDEWTRTQMSNGGNVTPPGGRWPANVILDEDSAALLDEQSGVEPPKPGRTGLRGGSAWHGRESFGSPDKVGTWPSDPGGGASRFFYTSKASRADRGPGNTHPTVKPSDLMKWLVKLTATPTGGTILDPFMGSGTTLYAAKEMGRKAIGIELNEEYCEIAARRLAQGVLGL